MQNFNEQIILAALLGLVFGYSIGLIIMDTKHAKVLKDLHERNQELEKLLSNGK